MKNDDATMKSNTFPMWRRVCSTTVLRLMFDNRPRQNLVMMMMMMMMAMKRMMTMMMMFDNRPRQNLASLVLRTSRQGQY